MIRRALLASVLASAFGCAGRLPPETTDAAAPRRPRRVADDVVEGLPPWMTHGEEVRLEIVEDFLGSGNTIAALEIVRQMRSEGYDMAELDLLQGRAMLLDGVTSEAERLLVAARRAMPRDPRPPAELCVLYGEEGNLELAIESCQRATKLDEKDARSWSNLGWLLLAAGRFEEAGEAAQEAVRIDGTVVRYRNNLAWTLVAAGRVEQAYRTLRSTMAEADAAHDVGEAVAMFEGEQAARPWYVRALEANPGHVGAREKLKTTTEGAEGAIGEDP